MRLYIIWQLCFNLNSFVHNSYITVENQHKTSSYVVVPYSLSTKRRGGAYTRDAAFSLAITPSLPVPRPQLRVQIKEDNAFDDFAVAIWKDVIHTCGSPM